MKVLIADDHQLLRDTLRSFLAQQPDMQIETAADVAQAKAAISAAPRFDLVLLDYDMPGMAALEGLQAILAGPNAPPVALISGIAPPDMVERAFQMGIQGFLHKAMPATSLLHAIRFMALGERFIPVEFLAEAGIGFGQGRAEAESEGAKLTPREMEVLRALCDGMTNKQIARDLELKEPTVKLHVKTLYRRLGVSNRTQAAMVARTRGLC